MPGGKVEHAEDPYDAVVRAVGEETGYVVEVERLLGELRNETGGSTDFAAWIPTSDIGRLERTVIIDIALDMYRSQPATGHVDPVEVGGLLRY